MPAGRCCDVLRQIGIENQLRERLHSRPLFRDPVEPLSLIARGAVLEGMRGPPHQADLVCLGRATRTSGANPNSVAGGLDSLLDPR